MSYSSMDSKSFWVGPQTTDAQWSIFSLKSKTFGVGQTNWADKFWDICGIFDQTISTHFGIVSPLSIISIIQLLFLQKLSLYIHIPNVYLRYLIKRIESYVTYMHFDKNLSGEYSYRVSLLLAQNEDRRQLQSFQWSISQKIITGQKCFKMHHCVF